MLLMHSRPRYGREIAGLLWQAVRLPMLLLLVILEPVVSFVFGALALLGVLTTIFYKLIGMPHFPTATMLSLSIGFGLLVCLYQGLIRILSR
jgi:hypothetical protein